VSGSSGRGHLQHRGTEAGVRGKIKWPEKARRRRSPNRVCCGGGGSNSGGFDDAPAVSHGQEARGAEDGCSIAI
jgi:hypothetical protein